MKTLQKNPTPSSRKASTIIFDASGIKVLGEGEWKVKIHGKGRPRKWINQRAPIDVNSQEIIVEVTTESSSGDRTTFPTLFNQIQHRVKTVIGEGAYDEIEICSLIKNRRGKALVLPPKHAVCRGEDYDRDQAVRDIKSLGCDLVAKSIWGKYTGYSRRALVETAFSKYKLGL